MRNLKIDPLTGDLSLAGGKPLFVEDQEAIAQAIRSALRTVMGEWFLDPTLGVPYIEAGQNRSTNPFVLGSVVKAKILAVPGVRSVDSMQFSLDRLTRRLSIAFAATSVFGALPPDTQLLGV